MNAESFNDPSSLLNKHRAFWQRANTTALVSKMAQPYWGGKPYPLRGRDITEPTSIAPDDIDLDRLLGLDRPLSHWAQDDMIESVGNVFPTAWMESVIGCSIHASAFGCVAKSPGIDLRQAAENFSMDAALKSEWFAVMVRMLARADQATQGQLAVRQWHMRGVVDMLAAYFGEAQLCTAVYDAPDALHSLADRFAQTWVAVAQRGVELRQRWNAGYVSAWRVYAPEPVIDYQVDASSLFSIKMYREHFLEADRQVLSAFPYSIVHTHATGLRHVASLITTPELRGIEIHLDRETGVWEKESILATCRTIQAHNKTIVLWGELDSDELREFQTALDPRGLAINYWEHSTV
ncbi:MAG: hypothetical protein HY868_04330 [Chloroflexi bacterium]|nr:hypothetical protein [Chloroflexota bacterium]